MHSDPSVYENPLEFIPERWFGDINPNMMRNFVPFSRDWATSFRLRLYLLTQYRFPELFGPESGVGRDQPCSRCAVSPWRRLARLVRKRMRRMPITYMTIFFLCRDLTPRGLGLRFVNVLDTKALYMEVLEIEIKIFALPADNFSPPKRGNAS